MDVAPLTREASVPHTRSRVRAIQSRMHANKQRLDQVLARRDRYEVEERVHAGANALLQQISNSWTGALPGSNVDNPPQVGFPADVDLDSSPHVIELAREPVTLQLVHHRPPPYTTWIPHNRNQRTFSQAHNPFPNNCALDSSGIVSDSNIHDCTNFREYKNPTKKTRIHDQNLPMSVGDLGSSLDAATENLTHLIEESCNLQKSNISIKPAEKRKGDTSGGSTCKETMETPCRRKNATAQFEADLSESDLHCEHRDVLSSSGATFDRLFCRRCLIFGCRLHKDEIMPLPSFKQEPWMPEDKGNPCSPNCFLLGQEAAISNIIMPDDCGHNVDEDQSAYPPSSTTSGRVVLPRNGQESSNLQTQICKGHDIQKVRALLPHNGQNRYGIDATSESVITLKVVLPCDCQAYPIKAEVSCEAKEMERKKTRHGRNVSDHELRKHLIAKSPPTERDPQITEITSETSNPAENLHREKIGDCWSDFEKTLFNQGLQIFGQNSCLIARNFLKGMKTCAEVQSFRLAAEGVQLIANAESSSAFADLHDKKFLQGRWKKYRRASCGWSMNQNFQKKMHRRKEATMLRHYSPCNCVGKCCGKDCFCASAGTLCEKYCSCIMSCPNRFKGCFCRKTHCWQSASCPCFLLGRECDPDVCKNCCIPCGDEELAVRLSTVNCRNMNLLLKQDKRLLLGKSEIEGWGVFLESAVKKHTFIGEYVGELISYEEAERRGVEPDREGAYLFDLNDRYVLDAYRRGSKTKFINHSSKPNCYARVMMVCGEHRIGIYAKVDIEAGKELFFDYRLKGDVRHLSWARRKKEAQETQPREGPARKNCLSDS